MSLQQWRERKEDLDDLTKLASYYGRRQCLAPSALHFEHVGTVPWPWNVNLGISMKSEPTNLDESRQSIRLRISDSHN